LFSFILYILSYLRTDVGGHMLYRDSPGSHDLYTRFIRLVLLYAYSQDQRFDKDFSFET